MLGRLNRAEVVVSGDSEPELNLLNDYGQKIATLRVSLAADSGRSDAYVTRLNLAREIARRINGSPVG